MGAVSYTSGSGSFNVPSVVQRAWVSCIGGGANGTGSRGGGGGGWGYGDRAVNSTSISYAVGGVGGTSACLGVSGGGASGSTGGGFTGPSGASGGNGKTLSSFNSDALRGGAAGGVSGGGNLAGVNCRPSGSGLQIFSFVGGGGNGNNGFGGTTAGQNGSITGSACNSNLDAGDGGTYGGGGGGGVNRDGSGGVYNNSVSIGRGATGFVYVSWIDLTAGKTTLRSGETTTVNWNSPVTSGSQQVSYTNTGTTNITRTFTVTDSRGAQSSITFTITPQVRIGSFTANPSTQTSGFDGVPNYDVTLDWSLSGATSFSVTDSTGATIATSGTSRTVTNLPQSTGTSNCSNPGASRSYTLTATDEFNTVSSSLSVTVFNDNTPNDFSVPNRTGLEPDTFYIINIGAINGIDMVTNVIGGPGVTVSKNNLNNFTSSTTITCNNSVQIRFRSDQFNKDPNGLPTAPKTLYVDIGTLRRFFTISTRAPIVKEIFNFQNENNRVPFPDIDTILTAPDHPAQQFIVSTTLSVDDVELQNPDGVEIRTNNGNAQIRKRITGSSDWGPWQDVRSI